MQTNLSAASAASCARLFLSSSSLLLLSVLPLEGASFLLTSTATDVLLPVGSARSVPGGDGEDLRDWLRAVSKSCTDATKMTCA